VIYSEQLIEPWLHPLRAEVPDLDLVDVHIHVGLADPAALLATEEEAIGSLELAGADGVVFPLKEPGGYSERTGAWASSRGARAGGSGASHGSTPPTTRSGRPSAAWTTAPSA
jgi:hypothetical protein